MRHATIPITVIAVTTIVARPRRVGAAALIGVLWGIGRSARRSHASTGVLGGLGLHQILRPQVVGVGHSSRAWRRHCSFSPPSPIRCRVAYLVLFGVGTIAGMMLTTAASSASSSPTGSGS